MSNPDTLERGPPKVCISGDAGSFLFWFRTPDPMTIASDPPGYTIHKTVTGDSAEYQLRRDWPDGATGYDILGTSHLCDIAMAAGERDYQKRIDGDAS